MALDIQVQTAQVLELTADVIVMGVLQASGKAGLSPVLKPLDVALGGSLGKLVAKEEFSGKRDQTISLSTLGRIGAERLILIGLGEKRSIGAPEVRTFAAKAARAANVDKATTLAVSVPAGLEGELRAVAEGLELGAYRFSKYLTGERKPKRSLASVTVGVTGRLKPNAKALVTVGQRVGAAVNFSRDLSNEPPNVIYPETFAAAAEKLAKENGLHVQVFDFKEIRRRGMKLIDAVGRGSRREPRFVHVSYTPKGAKRKLVFVGKGITFDTGGISIKPVGRHGRHEARHERRRERRRAHGGGRRREAEGRGPCDRVPRGEHARRRRLPSG